MSSKRSAFARQAEINRCIRLIDHYAEQGWVIRCERVFQHLLRLWRGFDWGDELDGDVVTRRWWMARAYARQRTFSHVTSGRVYFPSRESLMPVTPA